MGVEVEYSEGSTSVITRDAYGEVREKESLGGTQIHVYIAANGVLETGYIDTEAGTEDRFTYNFSTEDILPLEPWSGQSGEQVTMNADGEEINRIPFAWRTRGPTTFTLGECSYASIPLETYYYEPGDPSMVEFAYLIDLQIPIAIGYAYLAGGIGSAEPYHPVAIRPVSRKN